MFVQLNKCVVVCGSVYKEGIVVMKSLSICRFCFNMVVGMYFMFVLILVSSMVLGFVSKFVVYSVLLYVICFLRLGVVCCVVM